MLFCLIRTLRVPAAKSVVVHTHSALLDLPSRFCYRLPHGEDRKSTRLNSSHANISYAVFCLKKKTTPKSGSSSATMDGRDDDQPLREHIAVREADVDLHRHSCLRAPHVSCCSAPL